MLNYTLDQLHNNNLLSTRSYNVLKRAKYTYINELKGLTYKDIFFVRNSGYTTTNEIVNLVKALETNTLEDLLKEREKQELKQYINILLDANSKLKNKKVELMLNLANNAACSFGELKNAITICRRIANI